MEIFFVSFISAAGNKVAAHTFAAAVGAEKRGADVTARAAASLGGVITAAVAVGLTAKLIAGDPVFLV